MMSAYEILLKMVESFFVELGYRNDCMEQYFSSHTFKEILSIRLANANVVIKNKTDKTSHQTHIAITGEAIDFFYSNSEFQMIDNKTVQLKKVYVSSKNIYMLNNEEHTITDTSQIALKEGFVSIGKRTQKQVQLSKKNSENSVWFNSLPAGLYENDLLVLLKYRDIDSILAVGIPKTFYLDFIPNYASKYENNTYLCIPNKK